MDDPSERSTKVLSSNRTRFGLVEVEDWCVGGGGAGVRGPTTSAADDAVVAISATDGPPSRVRRGGGGAGVGGTTTSVDVVVVVSGTDGSIVRVRRGGGGAGVRGTATFSFAFFSQRSNRRRSFSLYDATSSEDASSRAETSGRIRNKGWDPRVDVVLLTSRTGAPGVRATRFTTSLEVNGRTTRRRVGTFCAPFAS